MTIAETIAETIPHRLHAWTHDPDVAGSGTTAAGSGTTAAGSGTTAAGSGTARSPETLPAGDAHLLRLSFDLQLDALLTLLGAVAADLAANEEVAAPPPGRSSGAPWARWLREDLERTCALARLVLRVRAALPATLGRDPAQTAPATVTADLLARYEGLAGFLGDLSTPCAAGCPEWQAQVRRFAAECEARMEELRRHRSASKAVRRERYLPGELLG